MVGVRVTRGGFWIRQSGAKTCTMSRRSLGRWAGESPLPLDGVASTAGPAGTALELCLPGLLQTQRMSMRFSHHQHKASESPLLSPTRNKPYNLCPLVFSHLSPLHSSCCLNSDPGYYLSKLLQKPFTQSPGLPCFQCYLTLPTPSLLFKRMDQSHVTHQLCVCVCGP